MGGTYLRMPQSIFQHMMNQQNPQQQVPQIPPISFPWSIPTLQQSEVMRFTGTSYEPIIHQKRKLETTDCIDMLPRTKRFMSEDKIAAHFQDLHISPNYQPKSRTLPISTNNASSFSHKQSDLDLDLDVDAANAIKTEQASTDNVHPKLVLSQELMRIPQESILPSTLLSKLGRPSMALVLWEPPNRHLRILSTRATSIPIPSTSDDNNNNSNNNNNENITPDLNHVLSDNTLLSYEPMEL